MENYTYRTFKVDGQLFSVKTYLNGHIYVQSIHPYDETEYHWARHKGRERDFWMIFRNGEFIDYASDYYDGANLTPEDIARVLLDLDHRAILQRRGGIW